MNEFTISIEGIKEAATWPNKAGRSEIFLDKSSAVLFDMLCNELNETSERNQWTRDTVGSCIVAAFLEQWALSKV